MYAGRTTQMVNPYGRASPTTRRYSASAGNPAWMLTLGPINPKRRNNVAKHKKKKKASGHHKVSHHGSSNAKHRLTTGQLMRLMDHGKKKKGRHHRSHNPFGASSLQLGSAPKIAVAAGGVLVGVAVNRGVVSILPAAVTSNNFYAVAASLAVALGQWWLFSMVSPEFGAAAGLGGIAETGSVALNTWFPAIGAKVTLGDFVPGKFAVPQNPVLDAAGPYSSSRRSFAYGGAYRVAAA